MTTIDPPRAIRVKTSTGWADLVIQGPPGTPGVPRFDYLGAWSASTPYVKGQLVVKDGVTYECVRDTSQVPPVWPSTSAVPTPVINGQWLKGVGGAVTWQPLTQADLPPNLGVTGQPSASVANLNSATASGWYQIDQDRSGGQVNRPFAYGVLHVLQLSATSIRQVAYMHDSLDIWQRKMAGTTWSAWIQTQFTPDATWSNVGDTVGWQNGWGDYGGSFPRGRFRKLASGQVVLSGLVGNSASGWAGANGTIAFTLPAAYRPDQYRHMLCASTDIYATVRVDTGGGVQFNFTNAGWVSLDNVAFYP